MSQLEDSIVELIRAGGPLTGAELRERSRAPRLALWQTCRSSAKLRLRTLGRRYLRLDKHVEGYARLSPSILREFLTYSVTGLAGDDEALEQRASEVAARIAEISEAKRELARRFVDEICGDLGDAWPQDRVCVILAGDIVYRMAHDVPRPERSTGKLVRGSDLDLILVLADDVSDDFFGQLDEATHHRKYRALITPSVREEIDYVVKKMARVHEQLRFDTFKRMLACKILREGVLLRGSRSMFDGLKSLLDERGVARKLEELEQQAQAARAMVEERLLRADPERVATDDRLLFYSSEESEEFD